MPRLVINPKKMNKKWGEAKENNPFKPHLSLRTFLEMQGVMNKDINRAIGLMKGHRDFVVWTKI